MRRKIYEDKPARTAVRGGAYRQWMLLGASLITTGALLGTLSENAAQRPGTAGLELRMPFAGPHTDDVAGAASTPVSLAEEWHTFTVKAGDNLSTVFSRAGLNPSQMQEVLALGSAMSTLKRLYPGDTLKFKIDPAGTLQALVYDLDVTKTLLIERAAGQFKTNTIEHPVEVKVAQATGVINSSLFAAGQKAGLSDAMTMGLANIFGWDIDFAQDIQDGDRFTVVYEEQFANGEKYRDGNILAAEFVNNGEVHRAVRYTNAAGESSYYTPDGRGMRKAFLRTPVDFSRISSGFSLGRYHPILNHIRAHKGVDYAAPIGTPVKTAGDGRVMFRGVKNGYGNVVEIQHGKHYSTLYGHLSRFGGGLRVGDRVHQGEIIGYVGMTGLATGPHLHYEFRIDSVHRNPLTVTLPNAEPLSGQERTAFRKQTEQALAQLDSLTRGRVAMTP